MTYPYKDPVYEKFIQDNNLTIRVNRFEYSNPSDKNYMAFFRVSLCYTLFKDNAPLGTFIANLQTRDIVIRKDGAVSHTNDPEFIKLDDTLFGIRMVQENNKWDPPTNILDMYSALHSLCIYMSEKAWFDKMFKKLKHRYVLVSHETKSKMIDNDTFSSSALWAARFIPHRIVPLDMSNTSPYKRKCLHVECLVKQIPVLNPEIFTQYKMTNG
jgi:hypothetical protein